MGTVKNILFIMADQLRADYLSCTGHRHLQTPNLDALARKSVLFDRAYVQSAVCGPSRMSYYTGRYMSSHGANWNSVPLRAGEPTLGDHLRRLGLRVALVGKTHMAADAPGLDRLGLKGSAIEGVFAREAGFEPYERDDGLHPDQLVDPDLAYNSYLRAQGYDEENPWNSAANAGLGANGEILSGWFMRHAQLPARVAEPHSETPYMTDRAMEFISESGDKPWCLHLSYIKPHWPYIAPEPYHSLYGPEDIQAANRDPAELDNPHPVYQAYRQHPESESFAREDVRQAVIPIYMGLIRQIDDHLGRLFRFLAEKGLDKNTLIVFTSDHGDYLGDHWLGEKELFHDCAARVPLIIHDPDPAADATRGTVDHHLVEAIDLAPTFVAALEGPSLDHIFEGSSLLPLLRSTPLGDWREVTVSELDYSFRKARRLLEVPPQRARAYMLRGEKWKYVFWEGFPEQLFDLENDPQERIDRGRDPALAAVRAEFRDRLFEWSRHLKSRITVSDADILQRSDQTHRERGIIIGEW